MHALKFCHINIIIVRLHQLRILRLCQAINEFSYQPARICSAGALREGSGFIIIAVKRILGNTAIHLTS